MKMRDVLVVATLPVLLALAPTRQVFAANAFVIGHQGILTDAGGTPLPNGSYSVTFRVFDAPSLGNLLWAETLSVSVTGGLFQTELGTIIPLSTDVFTCSPATTSLCPRYLELEVAPHPPLSPRVQVLAGPFAGVAQRVQGDIETSPGKIVLTEPAGLKAGPDVPFSELHGGRIEVVGPNSDRAIFNGGSIRLVSSGGGDEIRVGYEESGEARMVIQSVHTDEIKPKGNEMEIKDANGNNLLQFNSSGTTSYQPFYFAGLADFSGPMAFYSGLTGFGTVDVTGNATINGNLDVGEVACHDEVSVQFGNPSPTFECSDGLTFVDLNGDGNRDFECTASPTPRVNCSADLHTNTIRPIATQVEVKTAAGVVLQQWNSAGTTFNRESFYAAPAFFSALLNADFGLSGLGAFNWSGVSTFSNGTHLIKSGDFNIDRDGNGTAEVRVTLNPEHEVVSDIPVCVNNNLKVSNGTFSIDLNADGIKDLDFGDPLNIGAPRLEVSEIQCTTISVQDFFIVSGDVHFLNLLEVDGRVEVGGDLEVDGNLIVNGGVKQFAQTHPQDDSKEIFYVCLEGGEAGTYTRGSSQLVGGAAVIDLPEHFSLVTNENGLTAQVTPNAPVHGQLYVASKSTRQIVVKSSHPKDSDVTFDFMVNGVRSGFENHQVIRDKAGYADRN